MTGNFRATYELPISGVVFGGDAVAHLLTSVVGARATINGATDALILTLEWNIDDPQRASGIADGFAAELGKYLTLRFADHVDAAIRPKRMRREFVPDDTRAIVLLPDAACLSLTGSGATLTTQVSMTTVGDVLANFELRRIQPPPVFAADIENAREMYFVGMQAEHRVVRYLAFYSSLALFALFRWGNGGQAKVDELLLNEDPNVRVVTPPAGSGRTRPETVYTAARNTLIHAEARGKNPAGAWAEIEGLTASFQSIVARILVKG